MKNFIPAIVVLLIKTTFVYSQVPIAQFSPPDPICPGTCTNFTNLSINATSFLWTFVGGNPSTSTDFNPSIICYNTPGNHDVILIASGPGGSDTTVMSITVYPYPNPQGIMQNGDTLAANQGYVSYQWYYNGSVIPGATDYFYVTAITGDYVVVSVDMNGCEVEAFIDTDPWGFEEISNFSSINLFPNPVSDILEIKNLNTTSLAMIYNAVGKKVLENSIDVNRIDCRRLDPGIYWLEIISGEKIYHTKFMKQ